MNGYANSDTYFAANAILNVQNVLISARRAASSWALKNIFIDATEAGIIAADHLDIENIEFQEILDAVSED